MTTVCILGLGGSGNRDRADLALELSKARAEGMPTTWAEYAATIQPAKPSENAAPFYRQLKWPKKGLEELSELRAHLLFSSNPAYRVETKKQLAALQDNLSLIDKATAMPRCWFARDWSKGGATLMPEESKMRMASRILSLRGTLAAVQGRPRDAIANVKEILQISRHIGEEQSGFSFSVQDAVFVIGVKDLAYWSFVFRSQPAYQAFLVDTLKKWPKPDLSVIRRDDYLVLRQVLDMSMTPEGRADLGLKEEFVSRSEKFVPILVSRSRADVVILKSMRKVWESYREPPALRLKHIDEAWGELTPALLAYPTGGDVYLKLTGALNEDHTLPCFDQVVESGRLRYVAIARALSSPRIPKSIKTDDLLSPFDGKPLHYWFDGRQMTIEVSCPDKTIVLDPMIFPSDKDLGKG